MFKTPEELVSEAPVKSVNLSEFNQKLVEARFVVVALVEVELISERDVMEEEALTMMPTVVVGLMALVMPVGNSQVLPKLVPELQAEPVPETSPMPEICRHWVEPLPAPETYSWEVEAVLETVRLVEVELVKMAVLGVEAPRVAPLIVPPVIVTLGLKRLVMVEEAPPERKLPEI